MIFTKFQKLEDLFHLKIKYFFEEINIIFTKFKEGKDLEIEINFPGSLKKNVLI